MYCPCISMQFHAHSIMYLKEIIHLANPNLFRWRFMFMKIFLSVQKDSIPLHIFYTNTSNHVIKDESRGVRIAKTSFRVWLRIIK